MMGYGKRVLVVDDEESIGRLLVEHLELHYFAAVAAADGLRALRELHHRHFDAVITDLHMPYLDGLDLLRQCQLVWPQLPVILMSGNLLDTVGPVMAHGAFACLPKPVDTEKLIHVLSEATHTGDTRSGHVDLFSPRLEAQRCLVPGGTLTEESHAGDRLLDPDDQSFARRRPPTASVL
jgi:two-component system chemotaxis response regulator CheY